MNTVKAVNRESFAGNKGRNVVQQNFFIANKKQYIYGVTYHCSGSVTALTMQPLSFPVVTIYEKMTQTTQ